jgi:FkbM family methyltransferase
METTKTCTIYQHVDIWKTVCDLQKLFSEKKNSTPIMNYFEFNDSCQIPNLSLFFERYFGTNIGTFVEIGSFDGVSFSNTIGLAKRGWHGVLAEPDPKSYDLCCSNLSEFPNCHVFNVGVSSHESKLKLYRQGPLSTLSESMHEQYKSIEWTLGESINDAIQVDLITLDALLYENEIRVNFELLVVYVEGHETEVFEGFSLDRWMPQMIILELADFHPDFPALEKTCSELGIQIENNGYKIIYKDQINTIYISATAFENRFHTL